MMSLHAHAWRPSWCCLPCERTTASARVRHIFAVKGPPSAPPLQDVPPPPPPPPTGGPPRNVGFWSRRNILGILLAGSGLLYWRNYDEYDPHITFANSSTKPDGMEIIISPTGEPYGVTFVPVKNGQKHMVMLDAYGNMYYDPDDRCNSFDNILIVNGLPAVHSQLQVPCPDRWTRHLKMNVDSEANLVNAYVSSKTPGRIELERIGNLRDIKQIPIAGIADVKLESDGTVMWAFTDSEEPLVIDPLALVQLDSEGNMITAGFPGQIDEGVVEVLKEKKPLFGMFKKDDGAFGGPLKPDY